MTSKELLYAFLICLFTLTLLILFIPTKNSQSFVHKLTIISDLLYIPEKNLFLLPLINEIPLLIYFYATVSICVIHALILNHFVWRIMTPGRLISLLCTGFLILWIGLQTIGHIQSFATERKSFQGKSIAEKISVSFDKSYHFAQYCHSYLSGKHIANVYTELDSNHPASFLTKFAVAYYAYPIDTRIAKTGPISAQLIFAHKNPLTQVKEDFHAMPLFDDRSLIAIRKNK